MQRRAGAGVALLVCLAAFAGAGANPAPAQAGCGGVQRASPPHWRRHYRPPLAIGDSTMLLALPTLSREGFAVDAHGCRQYAEALALLRSLAHAHRLPHLVVVALGADGSITPADVGQTLSILGSRRQLALVTPRELGGGSGSDAREVRAEGRRHPRRIHVLDWVTYSSGHGDWFQPDGLHLTFSGATAFARLLRQATPLAAPTPPKPPPPLTCPIPPALPDLGSLNPAAPSVSVEAPAGVLHSDGRSTTAGITNHNPFRVVGRVDLHAFEPASGHPAKPVIASACVDIPAGGTTKLRLTLDAAGRQRLRRQQRFPVQMLLQVIGPDRKAVTATGTYLLTRSARSAGL